MNLLARVSIQIKLLLLAGAPVIGAIVLAAVIAGDARQRATTAAALGSIEDLARLTSQMSVCMHALQLERAHVALHEGLAERPDAAAPRSALESQYAATDAEIARLERFLASRDLSRIPSRLSRGLATARTQMSRRDVFRARVANENVPLEEVVAFYRNIDDSLIDATAALSQLSDDGELLRSISSLVALSQLAERSSSEHALLSYVFGTSQFPPGAFKSLVTLVTEESTYEGVFRANAADEDIATYDSDQTSSAVRDALSLRERALRATDDDLEIDAHAWFAAQQRRLERVHAIEKLVLGRISAAASKKVAATRSSIRFGAGLSAAVVLVSALLASFILRGTTRAIFDLTSSAARVRSTKDFSIRARKTSTDELGLLADAFNEMLGDIQARDAELEAHRSNLEELVATRTKELELRNESMRLVLDSVEQGLVTVGRDGLIGPERSAAFDQLLGAPPAGISFADHVARSDECVRDMLKLGWDMALEDVMPLDVVVDQLQKRLVHDGKHLTIGVRPILNGDRFAGALVTVTDVTSEVKALREEERQREYVAVFERVARDRDGFLTFGEEMANMLARLRNDGRDRANVMRILHTIKGNAAQWGASSVARIAHDLESEMTESAALPSEKQTATLVAAWEAIAARLSTLLGKNVDRIEVTHDELTSVIADLLSGVPQNVVARRLEAFKDEPVRIRFGRMVEDIGLLARRLGKPTPKVVVEPNGVRLPASEFGSFWASCTHVIRNLLDHGIESPAERSAAGKPDAGTVTLRATESATSLVLELADDGRGIDWEAVATKARAAGLPHRTSCDLERALFAAGVSTATTVSEISGRGVGLAAVAERCGALGGSIQVLSRRGAGTRFVFTFARATHAQDVIPIQRAC